jgi:hypothetical protein
MRSLKHKTVGNTLEVPHSVVPAALQANDAEDAMLAAAIAASLQDVPAQQQRQQPQQQPQPERQQGMSGRSAGISHPSAAISHPPGPVGQTPAGVLALKLALCMAAQFCVCVWVCHAAKHHSRPISTSRARNRPGAT